MSHSAWLNGSGHEPWVGAVTTTSDLSGECPHTLKSAVRKEEYHIYFIPLLNILFSLNIFNWRTSQEPESH